MVAASGESWAWKARVFQVPQVSPVKGSADVRADHGPAGETTSGFWKEVPIRPNAKPRSPLFVISWASKWSIQLSGVSPGMDTVELSQHQSSHQNATPWDSKGCWRAKFDSACGTWRQSHTFQAPMKHLEFANVWPAS